MQIGLESCGERQSARYYAICPDAQQAQADAFLQSIASMYEACGLGSVLPFPPCPRAPYGPLLCARGSMPSATTVPAQAPPSTSVQAESSPSVGPRPARPGLQNVKQSAPNCLASHAPGTQTGAGRTPQADCSARSGDASEQDHSLLLLQRATPGVRGVGGQLLGTSEPGGTATPRLPDPVARRMPCYSAQPQRISSQAAGVTMKPTPTAPTADSEHPSGGVPASNQGGPVPPEKCARHQASPAMKRCCACAAMHGFADREAACSQRIGDLQP